MTYVFNTGAELLACCREEGIPIHEAMIRRELELGDLGRNDLREEMQRNLTVMRASVEKGLEDAPRSVSGLSGGDAQKLDAYQDKALLGKTATQAAAAAMAVVEVNAAMGRIVAAPTAGASGILPGVLLPGGNRRRRRHGRRRHRRPVRRPAPRLPGRGGHRPEKRHGPCVRSRGRAGGMSLHQTQRHGGCQRPLSRRPGDGRRIQRDPL